MIENYLPDPPSPQYQYVVRRESPTIHTVWLQHLQTFDYTTSPVYTIWGFIKGKKVFAPINSQKCSKVCVGDLTEAFTLNPWSTMIKSDHIPQG